MEETAAALDFFGGVVDVFEEQLTTIRCVTRAAVQARDQNSVSRGELVLARLDLFNNHDEP